VSVKFFSHSSCTYSEDLILAHRRKMELSEAIKLINHKSLPRTSKTIWADVGCGSGLFTHALASQLASGSTIYAVDKDGQALKKLQPPLNVSMEKIELDFIRDEINLYDLDGIVMANSLHFVQDKISFLQKLKKCFKAGGSFLIVEYDIDVPNPWVPFPVSRHSLQRLFEQLGYGTIHKIHEVPSRYNRANIYSVWIH
jgi:ubiquinone/menaquinone biosynthesis C-methylase UbiE